MIIVDCKQGSPEWFRARLGVATASQAHRIITPKKMEFSKSSVGYRNDLLAEEILGQSLDAGVTALMQRGTEYEAEAIDYFELQRDIEVERVGFVLRDGTGRVGCSPDGLVGDDEGLEIKVPEASTHMGYMLNGLDDDHRCQIQGSLYVTGRAVWNFLSYNPVMPPVLLQFRRDDIFQHALDKCMQQFLAFVDDGREALRAKGYLAHAQALMGGESSLHHALAASVAATATPDARRVTDELWP